MTEFTRELIYGKHPVHRSDPKPGQSEWYYLDPRGATTLSDMKEIDVASENAPNPYANEIQNYLYKNDRYNYEQLYGNTPPPASTQSNMWETVKEWGKNFSNATQAASLGYATGMTLGNVDEMTGAMTALITQNPKNYTQGRDAARKLQNDLSRQYPYIYTGAEFLGAMTAPGHLTKGATKAQQIFNAATDTLATSIGYAENWKDFYLNMLVNGIANGIGVNVNMIPTLRGLGTLGRKTINQGLNFSADKTKDMFYNKDQ